MSRNSQSFKKSILTPLSKGLPLAIVSFGSLLALSICSSIYNDMRIKVSHRSFNYSHLKDEGHHEAIIHAQP